MGPGTRDIEEHTVIAIVINEAAQFGKPDPVAVEGRYRLETSGTTGDAKPHDPRNGVRHRMNASPHFHSSSAALAFTPTCAPAYQQRPTCNARTPEAERTSVVLHRAGAGDGLSDLANATVDTPVAACFVLSFLRGRTTRPSRSSEGSERHSGACWRSSRPPRPDAKQRGSPCPPARKCRESCGRPVAPYGCR
jgi:hypothetical protein